MSIWFLLIFQKINEIFTRISALASEKRGQIKKNMGILYHYLIGGFYFDSLRLLVWFDLFLEAKAEILEKFVDFLEDLKTPKGQLTDL